MSSDDQHIGETIRATAAAVRAPQRLYEAIERPRERGMVRRRRVGGAVAACATIALAAVLAFAHPAADPVAPSIADAAAVALRAPALPAPPRDAREPALLRFSSDGVPFPDYAYGGLAWRADGQRRARRGGRDVVVVSYAGGGRRVGYAIVGGPALRVSGARSRVVRGGTRFDVLRHAGATIVTWQRGGQTCVLASRDTEAQGLLRLASWRGRGDGRAGSGPSGREY